MFQNVRHGSHLKWLWKTCRQTVELNDAPRRTRADLPSTFLQWRIEWLPDGVLVEAIATHL